MRIILKTLLLFATLCVAALLLSRELYAYAVLSLAFSIWIVIDLYRTSTRIQREVALFAETIFYRDFTGKLNERNVSREIREVRSHFNTIIDTIRRLGREKEMHYQYLQKVLEVINTGILAYHVESGEVLWMNDAVEDLLQIPYLKSIHSLQKRNRALFSDLERVKPGASSIVSLSKEGVMIKVLVTSSSFRVDDQPYRLFALQNVNDALSENEVKAWQKLLSVLTHEIMNSVAPISSLSNTLKLHLQERFTLAEVEEDALEDLRTGIETIERRSEGLLRFAKTYRNLSKIGEPKLETVKVATLFEHIEKLLSPTFAQKEIAFCTNLHDTKLILQADPNLLEQVLVNLITNAMEAVKEKEHKAITLSTAQEHNQKIIKVSDNGQGIPPEMLERIFVPFFSSRPTGVGIGLSLSQQIMLMHKGSIYVKSEVGRGSVFVLQF
jgi:nitrogen fixation/metabolism regulation signal transduction histidine kinase